MDPDELVSEIVRHVMVINDPSTLPPIRVTHGEWLAERVSQLDALLVNGAPLPSRWRSPRALDPVESETNRRRLVASYLPDLASALDDVQRELSATSSLVKDIQDELDTHPEWCPGDHS